MMRTVTFVCYGLILGLYPLSALLLPEMAFNPLFAVMLVVLWLGLYGHAKQVPLLLPGIWQSLAVALVILLLFQGLTAWQHHILATNSNWYDFSDSESLATFFLQMLLLLPWVALMLRYGDWRHPAWFKSPKGRCAKWLIEHFDEEGQLHLFTLGYDLKAQLMKKGVAVTLVRGRQQFHQVLPDLYHLADFMLSNTPFMDEVFDSEAPPADADSALVR
ncbi:hypothetical protein [Gallaecimonas mangrovi]|uniref:hypothetical protein n=1 Tax=Gallaecimonas mangrovi TaxID=2291597 RepID=UPI000E2045D6|nr:hypothetical protein [Gallaecimonas mangrovi]